MVLQICAETAMIRAHLGFGAVAFGEHDGALLVKLRVDEIGPDLAKFDQF